MTCKKRSAPQTRKLSFHQAVKTFPSCKRAFVVVVVHATLLKVCCFMLYSSKELTKKISINKKKNVCEIVKNFGGYPSHLRLKREGG